MIPGMMDYLIRLLDQVRSIPNLSKIVILFMYSWLATCMIPAYWSYQLDKKKYPKWITSGLVILAGFGPLLCVITLQSYISELNNEELKWDKTEKTGKVALGG